MALTRKHLVVTAHPAVRHPHGYTTSFSLATAPLRLSVDAATTDEADQAIDAWLATLEPPTSASTSDGKQYDTWAVSARPGRYDAEQRRFTPARWAPGWKAHFDKTTYRPATLPNDAAPPTPCPVTARFQPEAWINDYAVAVDPEGDQEWDATDQFQQLPPDYRSSLASAFDADGEVIDVHDWFKTDPAAPAWVRDHRGPFTITLRVENRDRS